MKKRLAVILPLLALATGSAWAQDYPSRTITLIVPQTAGGNTDTLARIFASGMAKILGQEIVVENHPGAGNSIGTQMAAESAPDGYTISMASTSSHTLAPLTQPNVAYDPIEDFEMIYNFADVSNALVVNAQLGPKSIEELVALAKERPGELNYSSGGIGTTSHFAGAMFVAVAGIADITQHIPYQGGSQASVAAASGEVQFYVGPTGGNMTGVIDAGKVIPLAVSGKERIVSLPDVPTFAEAGLPEYTAVGYFGLAAPAGTPPEIIQKLNEAANEAAKTPEVIEALANQGIQPIQNTPGEFAAQVKEDIEKTRELIESGAVQLQ